MTDPVDDHEEAMELLDLASNARRAGNEAEAGRLELLAFVREEGAARRVPRVGLASVRGLLFKSAISLALRTGEAEAATGLIEESRRGEIAASFAAEIDDLEVQAMASARRRQSVGEAAQAITQTPRHAQMPKKAEARTKAGGVGARDDLRITEDEAFSLLGLCLTSPTFLDHVSERALRKLADYCRAESPHYVAPEEGTRRLKPRGPLPG